jgi:hypothetical protein
MSEAPQKLADHIAIQRTPSGAFAIGIARAFGGALIFSLPMLMTMEMWWLGFSATNLKLILLLLLTIPLLIGLSHYMGFEETFGFKDDALDASPPWQSVL